MRGQGQTDKKFTVKNNNNTTITRNVVAAIHCTIPLLPSRLWRIHSLMFRPRYLKMLQYKSILLIAYIIFIQISVESCLSYCSCGVAAYTPPSGPNMLQRALLKVGRGKILREKVVERYFDGVHKQNKDQIIGCFNPSGTKIRDVCGLSTGERVATPDQLGDRCMNFLAAHPDIKVMFLYK